RMWNRDLAACLNFIHIIHGLRVPVKYQKISEGRCPQKASTGSTYITEYATAAVIL
ncbi:hypothetical protein BX666DRAFT_1866589, partial [Dichotomocladium elegans]